MKHLVLSLFLLHFLLIHAQVDSLKQDINDKIDKIYILDKVWHGRDSKKFPTDDYPSFLAIQNGTVTLYSRSRNERFAYESPYLELVTEVANDETIIRFIGEANYKIPSRPSFEITEVPDDKIIIYIYHTLSGGEGTYFLAHEATKSEREKLIAYLVSQ